MIVTGKHIAPRVAMQARLTAPQAEDAIDAIGTAILHQLKNGHPVAIEGFGLFDIAEREDGSKGVRFRQGKSVRETLND
ncbi:HU family DNA-binding protein [Neptuniibacter marinus]|uniref:HU family DNA-binding protein n=1 Tax=Neptuniibacter marinus TaxID=1806670 RepID=UPI003B5B626C